jgi:glycosyltransferase involved in cell wall biosynthesis
MNALREFKPDVIHVHDPLQLGFLGAEYAKRAGIPSIVTIHAVPWLVSTNFQFAPGLASQIESILWMYAYWFVRQFPLAVTPTLTISHLIRRIVGVQPETISNGIDLQTFHPRSSSQDGNDLRKKLNIPAGVRVILHVGQLHSGKKADLVIRAAAQAMQHTNAHLLIVGDGPQKPDLIKLSKTLGISDRVHFPGYIKKEEGLPEAYRLSGVFVTASEIETQGLVLLEAAASGLPIVAVRATCIPEIVDNEINGHLADPGDVKGLGNAILEILENDPKAKTMGNASREIAEKHALQYTINAYEKLYLHLLGSRAAEKNRVIQNPPQQKKILRVWNLHMKIFLSTLMRRLARPS